MGREQFFKKPEIEPKDVLIETLEISIRTFQLLKNAGIITLQDLADSAHVYLGVESRFNNISKREIENILKEKGLHAENKIEDPKSFVDIEFTEFGGAQKFVQFEDEEGKTYIASYPMDICKNHTDIITKATDVFNQRGKKLVVKGAGFLSKIGDEISLWGGSRTLKLSFSGAEVIPVLQKAFPDLQITMD